MSKPVKPRKLSKTEREMQRLQKQLRKHQTPQQHPEDDEEVLKYQQKRKQRFVDRQGERDYYLEDIEADTLFREMKRREF